MGLWHDAFVISVPKTVEYWSPIGLALCHELQIASPFEIFPINSSQAIFHADENLSKAGLNFIF